jgi:phosphoglycolate phosphatase
MDGTLYNTRLSFRSLRQEMGLSSDGEPILVQLERLPSHQRALGVERLLDAESQGASRGDLFPGAAELLDWLNARGVACALITNNSRRSLHTVLRRHPLPFHLTLSRDDGPMKPSPELYLRALDRFGVPPYRAMAIGDSLLDVQAAHRAGLRRIHLVHATAETKIPLEVEVTVSEDLVQLRERLEVGWRDWTAPD